MGKIILDNGVEFEGKVFGYNKKNISSELVFNTSMVGYPEALTDPSYKSQILVLTYPCIGNYGVPNYERDYNNILKNFESDEIQIAGLIISNYSENYSHWSAVKSLSEWLNEKKIPGLYDIDTRELTKVLRENGVMNGKLLVDNSLNIEYISSKNLVKTVSRKEIRVINENKKYNIAVIDCGIKNNIIRKLLRYDDILTITLVPYDYKIDVKDFDGILLSNGPGNPKECLELIENIREIIDNRVNIPIFGICLGNQILGLASGANTIKLVYGNRGINQPVIDLKTRRCYMTTQNHGYAIEQSTLKDDWNQYFINANDFSNEGIIHKTLPYYSVQFHPEANNGPDDTDFLFDMFIDKIKNHVVNISDSYFDYYYQLNSYKINKILLLGSGGLSIGQAGEFDYSGSQAIKALKEENKEIILINPNIATVQTSKNLADKIYYLAVNYDNVKRIIETEKPDAIMINFGGQTALNCAIELYNNNIFEINNVKILGTEVKSIIKSEDREAFASLMEEIGEPVAKRFTLNDMSNIDIAIKNLGFPMIIRNGFALGGLGSCFIENKNNLIEKVTELFKTFGHILLEQSIKGWKELEYEIVRDYSDNCIAVCNMENFDPVGIHTGDSIVIAPSQTLSNEEYYLLRKSAIKIARALKIVGECNVQFAVNPNSKEYIIIELNPRLSRSSALASKATGYPLAYIAAKILLGKNLTDLRNNITKKTTACYEPSLDYLVIKIPKWEFQKFKNTNKLLDTSMKSIGEVMAIGRNFEETIQKAIRMVYNNLGFYFEDDSSITNEEIENQLKYPSYNRILFIALSFKRGYSVDSIFKLTNIDRWFLHKLYNIHKHNVCLLNLKSKNDFSLSSHLFSKLIIIESKKIGFSDKLISKILESNESDIRNYRYLNNIFPKVKQIDTTAAEFPAQTNYLYTTYNGDTHDVEFKNNGIIVLGCGSYKIGSSVEFDWCAVNCINTLRKNKEYSIVINYNPETVSTDYDVSDRLYFEELSLESIIDIYKLEESKGIIISVGGQVPNNLALGLNANNVKVIGTHPINIDRAEDRHKFSQLLDKINVDQPKWKEMTKIDDAIAFCKNIGYPVLIRPSYVLSGAAMNVAQNKEELEKYLNEATDVSNETPVVISKFIENAKEIEVDAVADNGKLISYAISEHLENAGIHSGDATIILPAQKLYLETIKRIKKVTKKIADNLEISGPFNIQFISKDNEIKVIECNLRASRSFPFVSKTLDTNFIDLATNIMMGNKYSIPHINIDNIDYVGIKAPVFSFNRLSNVDPILGVEMVSTGEIATFGYNVTETYIKTLLASGFKLPKNNILIIIDKNEDLFNFLPSIKLLIQLGFNIFSSHNTYNFLKENNIENTLLNNDEIINNIEQRKIELLINIQRNNVNFNNNKTIGFTIRRKCIDFDISVLTNIKCAKLFVASLMKLTKKI